MRTLSNPTNLLRAFATAGTHVVTLGFDLDSSLKNQLLGFSIQRIDHGNHDKTDFLDSMKVFRSVMPVRESGKIVSTEFHPIQDFFWSDFTARPGNKYTYRILARGGTPANLVTIASAEVHVQTEDNEISTDKHNVFFNRGVAGSQAFVRRFDPEHKDIPFKNIVAAKPWVFDWLSRGLKEAMFNFLQSAKDGNFQIRASIYEFSYEPVLDELKAAMNRGVDVQLVVHAPEKPEEFERLDKLIKIKGLLGATTYRHTKYISHNKFFILIKNGKPQSVWTGSTNFTLGGIFGHSNVGHCVNDKNIANQYLDYWSTLAEDPSAETLKAKTVNLNADPTNAKMPTANSTNVYFSPREKLALLDWYANLVDSLGKPTFMTFPFGLDVRFEGILAKERHNPIYVITDKEEKKTPSGKGLTAADIRANLFNQYAFGDMIIAPNKFEGWLKERLTGANKRVNYIHTKYILIDPLGPDPITITGSANFSESSVKNNDENTLIIRGDTRVADLYFGEFMRLFRHFYFRNLETSSTTEAGKNRIFLDETPNWVQDFYVEGSAKEYVRQYFSGKHL